MHYRARSPRLSRASARRTGYVSLVPMYEYRCASGHLTDEVRSVEARHDPMMCGTCGAPAEKIISRVGHAIPDISGYRSVLDGRWIGSRSSHREHMRAHGVVEVGNERLPARTPIKAERPRETVERVLAMDPSDRRNLAERIENQTKAAIAAEGHR